MKHKMTRAEADAAFTDLSASEKTHFEKIREYCEECRRNGIPITRAQVRAHVNCGSDVVVKLLRILEAQEQPEESCGQNPSACVPPSPASATASFERIEQILRRAFESAIHQSQEDIQREFDTLQQTHIPRAEGLIDFEELASTLASELATLRRDHENQKIELSHVWTARNDAFNRIEALKTANQILHGEIERLRRESFEKGEMNAVLAREHEEVKRERDTYRNQSERQLSLIEQLKIQNAVLKEQRDSWAIRTRNCESLFQRIREEYSQQFTRLQEEYKRLLDQQREMLGAVRAQPGQSSVTPQPSPETEANSATHPRNRTL